MPATEIDFHARYSVDGWRGIAFYLRGYAQCPDLDCEDHDCEDPSRVIAVMVGDDRKHVIDVEDLTMLEDEDYCHECGQIGCTHDGLERD